MPPELINLLIQLPIVAAFIIYSERKDKQFIEALREQRLADREIMNKLLERLNALHNAHEEHDQRMTQAVAQMEERTRRTRPR
ncbi:MAG: hypothetical protein UY48_C0029G0012 [Candidatus Gottesmanbacteria bacterium GW2011_GWB1_49_7]|uniref:Uncharacterized protein n=1 Tax=Candidatus Gottesmanbacteria bacterium GW2011_GWB1_49_7 TaxID=1618448 RepID=A0A0G1VWW3_9BACT|nr:MAG: hypothetical protein UY48_C0029G0012 [Candidatus Gottesmanbacteria bacterium GW2011_GWB1_49_7]